MPNVVFTDSYDHYSYADMGKKYVTTPSSSASFVTGRNGNAFSVGSFNSASFNIAATQTVYFEAAMKWSSVTAVSTAIIFRDGSAVTHLDLRTTAGAELQITRNGTVLATTSGLGLLNNTWYHVGFYGLIDDTTGAYELRIDGMTKLSATNVDTRNAGTASVATIFLNSNASGDTIFDDLVVSTDGFCGDCVVKAIFPNGVGNYSQWTPSTGLGWQCVDEAAMNSDTDYVSSATPGQRNSYDFASVGTGTIKAVQQVTTCRKDDTGSRTIKQFARISGTDYDGTAASVSGSYVMQRRVMSVNPATGTAWTGAQVDASEFGAKLES